jgi:hypothetical protein
MDGHDPERVGISRFGASRAPCLRLSRSRLAGGGLAQESLFDLEEKRAQAHMVLVRVVEPLGWERNMKK